MFKSKFVILILLLLFLPWLLPGTRVATDFPLTSHRGLLEGLSLPQTWTSRFGNGLGEYSVGTMWAWPLDLSYGLGAKIGLEFGALERLFGLLPALALGYVGLYALAGPVGGLIYLANSYFLLLVDGGQLGLALAYGILPICVYLYFRALESQRLSTLLKFALAVMLLSVADLRIVYFLVLLMGVNFLFHRNFLVHLKIALVTGLFLIGIHSYWLMPAFFSRAPSLPIAYTSASEVDFLSFATLNHALLLAQPHWPKNVFGHISSPSWEFVTLPILVFAIFSFVKHERKLAFWGFVAMAAVFLSKGNNPPLGSMYSWLFIHVPGFSLFRDPVKFYFLIALAYAILAGTLVHKYKFKAKYYVPLLAVYLLSVAVPIYTQKMTGTFSTPRFEADYAGLNTHLEADQSFGRVLWVPSKSPMGFSGPDHPTLEGLQLGKYRPFVVGTFGTYETMSFLRDASASAQLLQIAGVKYVVYPPLDPLSDSQKPEDKKYYANFLTQLSQTSWAGSTQKFGQVPLVTSNRPVALFFIPDQLQFVVGSDSIYNITPDLTKTSYIFAEDRPNLLNQIISFPSASVKLHGKTPIDASAALISTSRFIFPAKDLPESPDSSGWWKRDTSELLWWRSFLQDKYAIDNQDFDYHGGWAISEGSGQLTIPNSISESSVLLARVMHSPIGGKIGFYLGDQLVGEVSTLSPSQTQTTITVKGLDDVPDRSHNYERSEFLWHEVGPVPISDAPINIRADGELNVVNSLAILPTSEWNNLLHMSAQMLAQPGKGNINAEVDYQKISATHYKVGVKNLLVPGMLVFSQNYDPLWELEGQSPVLVYSFLNGFPIDRNGEYDLVFTPQKFVLLGMILSIFTLGTYLGLVVYTKLWSKD